MTSPNLPAQDVAPVAKRRGLHYIVRGSAIILAVTVFQKGVGLILFLVLAHHYGLVELGKWNIAIAYLGFFNVLCDDSVDTIVVREIAQDRGDLARFIGSAILVKGLLGGCAYAISTLIVIVGMPYDDETKVLIVIGGFTFVTSFITIYGAILQARSQIGLYKSGTLVNSSLTLLGGVALPLLGFNLTAYMCLTMAMFIPTFLVYWYFSRRFIRPSFQVDYRVVRSLAREALPLAMTRIFGVIYYRIDIILLSVLRPLTSATYYGATYRLTEVLNILPGALMLTVAPLLATYAKDPLIYHRITILYRQLVRYLLLFILPVAIGCSVLADQIIGFLYGPEFGPAATTLRILIWADVPMFLSPVIIGIFIAHHNQKVLPRVVAAMVIFTVAANAVLIPLFDYNGAALSTVLAETFGLILWARLLAQSYHTWFVREVRGVLLCLIPFTACLLLPVVTHILVLALPAGVVYLICVLKYKIVQVDEIRALLSRST